VGADTRPGPRGGSRKPSVRAHSRLRRVPPDFPGDGPAAARGRSARRPAGCVLPGGRRSAGRRGRHGVDDRPTGPRGGAAGRVRALPRGGAASAGPVPHARGGARARPHRDGRR
jgi:hypothetical protein